MSEELRMYRTYARFVKRFLLAAGIWPKDGKRNIVYRCLSIWSISSCFISLCALGNCCLQNVTNISSLTAPLSLFATMLSINIKAFCFLVHRKKLRLLNYILDSLLEEALIETRLRSIAFFLLRTFYRSIYVQTILMATAASIYAIKPLLAGTLHAVNDTITKEQRTLPLLGVYPWSMDSTLIWQLHYLFETNVCWHLVCISTGVDAFFGFCLFRMSALLRLLAFQFEILSKQKCEKDCREMFRVCVEKHVSLLRCRDIVQQVYGPTILFVTVTNAVCMCGLIFQTFQVKKTSIETAGLLPTYFIMKLIQTFMYAWPGDVILSESELLRREVYCSDWYKNDDTNFTKQFLLVLGQRPIVLKACDILEVSLDLFVKILNTTISYYFLLETLDNKK